MALAKADIIRLLKRLNEELANADQIGELYLVGGAVMCLVLEARPATKDIDAWFRPSRSIREAAKRVSVGEGVEPDWLNDAVKGYLSASGTYSPYLDLSNLRVSTATPEYLLAMKCLAMRLGEEFHDEEDVRFLLRFLNLARFDKALDVVGRYYPLERIPQKTLYALEELLGGK